MVKFVFFFLAILVILENLYTLFTGIKYHGRIKRLLASGSRATPRRALKAVLIIPCKGLDPGFKENIQALFHQNYSPYHLLFVTATAEDPAFHALIEIIRENPQVPSKLVIAGLGSGCSQKVHNLKIAVQGVDPDDEIYVFADSDIRPHSNWLGGLVAPLIEVWYYESRGVGGSISHPPILTNERVGATTGYRWYLPHRGNLGSLLRMIWNGNVLPVLEDPKLNFAWGGSLAIPRKVFEKAEVLKSWEGVLSDDYALTWALKKKGYQIRFVPRCLVLSHEGCTLKEFLEWSARQMIITRVYYPLLWKLATFSFVTYNLTLVLGIALIALGSAGSLIWSVLVSLMGFPLVKSHLRLKTVLEILSANREQLERYRWGYVLLSPVVAILNFYISFKSAVTHCITWRGVTYGMRSPTEIVVYSTDA